MKGEKWVKENLEAIAIAVVMALVIRQFAIEAFKIPTESMAPTLLGDDLGGTGDRILVDKILYRFGEPKRGDVIVFKYPLNAAKNYIKRLIGLPGERVSIRNGDIWIDGEVWRKPSHVQESHFLPIYPGEVEDEQDLREAARVWECDEDSWSRVPEGGFRVESTEGESLAAYGRSVTNWGPRSGGLEDVGDVRLRLSVKPEGGAVILRIVEGGVVNELELAVGGGESRARHAERSWPLEGVVLAAGKATDVSFANVDDTLLIEVGGEDFRFDFESVDRVPGDGHAIRFGVRAGAATFTEIGLDRDIYYTNEGNLGRPSDEIEVPPDCFYVLGDNSSSSADSRRWKVDVMELVDGTEIRYDSSPSGNRSRRRGPPGTEVKTDIKGKERVVRSDDIVRTRHFQDAPFVPRENLIGRAFFVFWPLNPLKDQFRLKFIR